MDIVSYSRQQSNTFKSPRVLNQPTDPNARNEENDSKKFLPAANGTSSTAKIFHSIIKDAGSVPRDPSNGSASNPKVLKNLMNRSHLQDSNKRTDRANRAIQFNRSKDFGVSAATDAKRKQTGGFGDVDEFDDPNLRDYEDDTGIDTENQRFASKLPMINANKKALPKVESNKKLDRASGLEKHLNALASPKGDSDMSVTQQSLNNKVTTQPRSPSPSKQPKSIWKSPAKYGLEDREYYIDGRTGKIRENVSKGQENGNPYSPTVVVRARFSSGGARLMQNTLSGGEEEESNTDNLGFSLMISPMKGSHRAAKHMKKNTEVLRQVRASSPETKDNSVDYAELRKVRMKMEQQKNGGKKTHLKKGQDRASSVIYPAGSLECQGQEERKKDMEGWDKNESEGSDTKDPNDDDDSEEKKLDYNNKDDEREYKEDIVMKKEEKDKNKDKVVTTTARKGGAQQKEAVPSSISKQAKRLQDHIQISRVGDKEKETVQMKREQAYKEFMLRLNFSFNVQVRTPTEKTFIAYKYFLGKGNNSILLKTLMKQRWWWVQVETKEAGDVNFMWTQLKQNKFIGSLKQKRKSPFDTLDWSGLSSSHCNDNSTTSTTTTFIDSMTDCESDTTESESKVPVKKTKKPQASKTGKGSAKKERTDQPKTQEDILTSAQKRLFTNNEITLMNSVTDGKAFYPEDCEEIARLRKGPSPQVVVDPSIMRMCNHLESNFHLANKKALLWNMKSYYEAIKKNVFDYLPLTFHVRNGFEDPEYQKFVEYYNNREKEIQEQERSAQEPKEGKKSSKKLRNIWIVKPGENTNRGIGIHVCDSLSQINELVATTEGNANGKRRTYLIQQYLDRPLLYNKRKFDIRCYVLMTCINGMMKGYWYQDGYIRTASKEFSLKNVTNKFVHLTNDAIQKKAEDYGKFESGNKVSYGEFQKYLDTHHDGSVDFSTDIYPKIKQLATDAIRGVYGKIDPNRRENCFEVFGLDFMIDTNLKAWLIEVNTNPDINASSPVLTRVIPPMVENALRLTIDQMYPPPAWHISKKQMLPENLLENNKFELVFDEVEDGPALRNILQADKGATGDLILEIVAEEEEEDAEEEIKD